MGCHCFLYQDARSEWKSRVDHYLPDFGVLHAMQIFVVVIVPLQTVHSLHVKHNHYFLCVCSVCICRRTDVSWRLFVISPFGKFLCSTVLLFLFFCNMLRYATDSSIFSICDSHRYLIMLPITLIRQEK